MGGGYLQHLVDLTSMLKDSNVPMLCHIHASDASELARKGDAPGEDCAAVAAHDRLVPYMGRLALGSIAARLRSGQCYLVGWPTRSVLFGSPCASVRQEALAEFRRSFATFKLMEQKAHLHPVIASMVRRSAWMTTPCQQLVEMLRCDAWEVKERFQEHCRQSNSTLWSDQAPEDGFNYAKVAARKVPNQRLSHLSVWLVLVKRHVLERVHTLEATVS